MRSLTSISIWMVLLLSVVLILLGHEDPVARQYLCSRVPCLRSTYAPAWNKTLYDLGLGGLVSLVFYWLLVVLPERQKRSRLKRNLEKYYQQFKLDCLFTILGVTEGAIAAPEPKRLLDVTAFRAFYKQEVGSGQTRWDKLLNRIREHHIAELAVNLAVLRYEVAYVLNQVDLDDQVHNFLKRLSMTLYSIDMRITDIEDGDRITGFLWQVLSGWDSIDGYRDEDLIANMIADI